MVASGYVLKEEVARFAKELDVWWKRKRGGKANFRVLGLRWSRLERRQGRGQGRRPGVWFG